MPLLVNLRHLEAHDVQLDGELPVEELDIDTRDEVIQLAKPLRYDLVVQKLEDGLLAQGRLSLALECQCVRCLKPFQYRLELAEWATHVPLKGEDAAPVVSDCVDLTPCVRDDILLEFPQHPLCEPDCGGLPKAIVGKARNTSSSGPPKAGSSAWDELNKLKL
jgi:uncharacterized metal-binding protein YceD (DUF177 family)